MASGCSDSNGSKFEKDTGFSSVNIRKCFNHEMPPSHTDEMVVYERKK